MLSFDKVITISGYQDTIMSQHREDSDDRRQTLREILSRRNSSLAGELREIQKHAQCVEKAHRWAASPLCLLYQRASQTCFRVIRNRRLNQNFVAISWTWAPSIHEDPTSGKYSILHANAGKRESSDIRNSVLDRIVKYLEHVNIDIFWIDRVCIDQHDSQRKAQAMNSMDLIYRSATKSLGLLTTPIRTKAGLQLFELLVSGDLCGKSEACRYVFRYGINGNIITKVIRILQDIQKDVWWNRAWVFQEEYVSGLEMDLLIPVAPGAQGNKEKALMSGEVCVGASAFREQATMFLLACLNSSWDRYRKSCVDMLNVFGKYNILLSQDGYGLQSMSARIFADIGRRGISEPWDTLAITANACGYETRLDKAALFDEDRSLSLSLLAQFLLNGEIVMSVNDSSEDGYEALDVDIAKFLEKLSLKNCEIPVESRQLSFLKNCRLPSVRICNQGMRTFGFIWELRHDHRIHTSKFALNSIPRESRAHFESYPWESQELTVLAYELEKRHPALAHKLRAYIDRRKTGSASSALSYMDRMAWSLVRAIDQGYILRVGYLMGGGAGGIFIPNRCDVYRSMHAFTAWQPRHLNDELDKFVSLKVAIRQNVILETADWMNGLVILLG